MPKYSKLNEVRIKNIKPLGWIKSFLDCQAEGIVGHLHEIGYPFDRFSWQYKSLTDGGYAQWWPYEQNAYWIDSVVRNAVTTDNDKLLDVVMGQIEKSLSFDDAYIGPDELKCAEGYNRWPHAVYFRALYALWSYTGEEKYLEKMRKHYLNDTSDHYSVSRSVVNIETMLKLYDYFGDESLKKLAMESFEKFDSRGGHTSTSSHISDKVTTIHGVSYNEDSKLCAIMYMYTGDKKYLWAAVNAYKKIDTYHTLPDGLHTCSEGLCGNETWRTHESCDISDYTWSLGYLLEATGRAEYADKIERVCFNALPGATGHYFKTIQYLSCVNQVICARNSTHISSWYNTPRMAYQPHHYPECCVSNIGRTMPNYVFRMYQKTQDGVCASLYGDSIYDGDEMRLEQTGGYPFSSETSFKITLKDETKNSLMLRIPSWTKGYTLKVNDKVTYADDINGYISIAVKDNDTVKLEFNMALTQESSPDDGFYYNYGPFLMTLKIDEDCVVDTAERRQTADFPAYNIYPASEWRYAVKRFEYEEVIKIIHNKVTENPFWDKEFPIEIKVKARKLNNWDFEKIKNKFSVDKKEGEGIDQKQLDCGATIITEDLVLTPRLPDSSYVNSNLGEEVDITLVPYGCTTIRLTVFPKYTKDFINNFEFLGE